MIHDITYVTNCFYCGEKYGTGSKRRTTDHVIPSSKGGSNRKSNRLFCCSACNGEKGNMMPIEFMHYTQSLIDKHRSNVFAMPMLKLKLQAAKKLVAYTKDIKEALMSPKNIIVKDGKRLYYD